MVFFNFPIHSGLLPFESSGRVRPCCPQRGLRLEESFAVWESQKNKLVSALKTSPVGSTLLPEISVRGIDLSGVSNRSQNCFRSRLSYSSGKFPFRSHL
jgi:hypothetical protein